MSLIKLSSEAYWHKRHNDCTIDASLRARALDTFSYLIAPAQYGLHSNGRKTYGHSMIVNPWGEIEAIIKEEKAGIAISDIHLNQVYLTRKKIIK